MTSEHLLDAVRHLRRATALVVGDAMLDRYVYGSAARISPEAPVPVLTVEREVALPGGAGNVVRCLTALGTAVAFVSVVGDDQAGSDLTGLVGGQPGVEPWLLVQGGRTTTTKTRFVASGQQMLRADREETTPIHPRLADRLVRIATDASAATAVMVLSDYRKGVLAGETPARLIAAARGAGRKVLVDPKGVSPKEKDWARFAGADLIVPEATELAEATGLPTGTPAEVAVAAGALRAAHGFGAVLVICGEEGLVLVQAAEGGADHVLRLHPEAGDMVDPAGAADAVVAVCAAGLANGLPLPVVARLAALALGIAFAKTGIAVVREEDFQDVLTPGRLAARKLASRTQAVERVEGWRRRGFRVGFLAGHATHLLNAGHPLLEQASDWCDRLVVAVPAATEADGTKALADLALPDMVTRYDGDSAVELIRALRPDVLVQPARDVNETVPGSDILHEWGGELKLAVIGG